MMKKSELEKWVKEEIQRLDETAYTPSKEFKNLVKKMKGLGKGYQTPPYLGMDKSTGEIKQTPKNLVAWELVQLFHSMPKPERDTLLSWRTTDLQKELESYAQEELPGYWFRATNSVPDLWRGWRKKLENLEKTKEKERKRKEVEGEKQKLINSLNRKDVKAVIQRIKGEMEPYIKRGEMSIKDKVVREANEVRKDYKKDGIGWVMGEYGVKEIPKGLYDYVKMGDGTSTQLIRLIKKSPFMQKYKDKRYGYLTLPGDIQTFIEGNEEHIYNQRMKIFRKGEEIKVQILFHRLFNSNPTLRDYKMVQPYTGSEFVLGAVNEKGEEILIETNTIYAGGYNIQRLHTRWLVSVRNTVTGKVEKFKITEKDKK